MITLISNLTDVLGREKSLRNHSSGFFQEKMSKQSSFRHCDALSRP